MKKSKFLKKWSSTHVVRSNNKSARNRLRALSRSLFLLTLFLITFSSAKLLAGECALTSSNSSESGGITNLLGKIWNDGGCLADSAEYKEKYSEYISYDGPFHVIRIKVATDIFVSSLPALHGKDGRPILIVADKTVDARLIGNINNEANGLTIGGNGGSIIIDNLSIEGFGANGIKIDSDKNLIINSRIIDNGLGENGGFGIEILGQKNYIVNTEVIGSGRDGIVIGNKKLCGDQNIDSNSGYNTILYDVIVKESGQNSKYENDGFGIYINADRVGVGAKASSKIQKNKLSAIYIESKNESCADSSSGSLPRNAIITKIHTNGNGGFQSYGSSYAVAGMAIPSPTGVAFASDPNDPVIKIVGQVAYNKDVSRWVINPNELRVDVYTTNGFGELLKFIGRADGVDSETGEFILVIENQDIDRSSKLSAVAIDMESWYTSKPSRTMTYSGDVLSPSSDDSDGDGLKDIEEPKYNTDPFNPDSDSDGLTDGEEVHHIGLIAKLTKNMLKEEGIGLILAHPSKLNPTNPDSDGDCLPDGLELGVSLERLEVLRKNKTLDRAIDMNPKCGLLLKKRKVDLENAILIDKYGLKRLENVLALYDFDSNTLTDPTLTDTDDDGLSDGDEDWNCNGERDLESNEDVEKYLETDPQEKDSDDDGMIDGDEGDRNGNDSLDPFESSAVLKDTDNDGISDSEEKRMGSLMNSCDTDSDGLPDGIEAGVIHTNDDAKCRGLQTSGSNFFNIGVLDLTSSDSDGDGIPDGDEDLNANGWLDKGETDPSSTDTDDDGIDDYVEMTGDLDGDGVIDIDPFQISNGSDCSPPAQFSDADCDSLPNATDNDSDNDGCMDRDESITRDGNMNGIPDPYDSATANCGDSSGGGGGSMGSLSGGSGGDSSEPNDSGISFSGNGNIKGGGACSLNKYSGFDNSSFKIFIILLIALYVAKKVTFRRVI